MILKTGNMFRERPDVMIVTTNSTLRRNGSLVMGRGAALNLTKVCPGIDSLFGSILQGKFPDDYLFGNPNILYGVIFTEGTRYPLAGAFQVKQFWGSDAELEIIQYSVSSLQAFLKCYPQYRVIMNFPGIGNGKLAREAVLPLLQDLPNNLEIWELPS